MKVGTILSLVALCSCSSDGLLRDGPSAGSPTFVHSAATPIVRSFRLPGAIGSSFVNQQHLVADRHGGAWVLSTSPESGHVFITHATASGIVTNTALPHSMTDIGNIAIGPDGRIYFPLENASAIGVLDGGGKLHTYATPTKNIVPSDVVPAPDGLWFAEGFFAGREGIGKIDRGGHIVEFRFALPENGLAGQGAAFLQDDGNGGVWFVATRHLLICVPVACPPWIGHLGKNGTLTKYSFTYANSGRVWNVAMGSGAYWFGANFFKAGVSFAAAGKNTTQYTMPGLDALPIGAIGDTMWLQSKWPFSLSTATIEAEPSRIDLKLPRANDGDEGNVSATVANGFIWLVVQASGDAYRYNPANGELKSAHFGKGESGEYTPVVSNNRLWFTGKRLWSIDF